MSDRTITHSTFKIERTYEAPPARVFAAWADPEIKRRWFGGSDEAPAKHELDFRVGGQETVSGGPPDGPMFTYEARYRDIVPGERIVYTYDMYIGEERMSVSVATVELAPAGEGTKLTLIEQGAFLDGLDTSEQREHGTRELIEKLGTALESEWSTK